MRRYTMVLSMAAAICLLLTACGSSATESQTEDGSMAGSSSSSAAESGAASTGNGQSTTGNATNAAGASANESENAAGDESTTAVSAAAAENTTTASSQGETNLDIPTYDLDLYTRNVWEGNTVYYESVGYVETTPGNIASGSLLYTPGKVISVMSNDLQYAYKEGVDYVVEGNKIVRTNTSSIPYCPYDTYMPSYTGSTTDWLISVSDSSRHINCTSDIRQYQVMVTYEHSDSWTETTPSTQAKKLTRSMTKLKNKDSLKIVYYGDSITAGYEASGSDELVLNKDTLKETGLRNNKSPYMPAWASMVTSKLSSLYDNVNITKVNRGAGGSDSNWGVANAQLVADLNPDLVVIGFGMNEVGKASLTYKENILQIIATIRAANSKADILLVSCMLPNVDCASFANNNLDGQEDALYEIANELSGVAVAPVHTMFKALQAKGKLYTDYTGNNLNHPNDFAIRIYAQTILATLAWPS